MLIITQQAAPEGVFSQGLPVVYKLFRVRQLTSV